MPVTTPRLGIPTPISSENPDIPAHLLAMATVLDKAVLAEQGPGGSRPAAGIKSRRYLAEDTGQEFVDTGSAWLESQMTSPVLTALPGSPYSGREILFQTAAMKTEGVGPWRLRYDSTISGSYKWGAVSAGALSDSESTIASIPSATYTDVPFSPTILLPLEGDYEVHMSAQLEFPGNETYQSSHIAPVATGLAANDFNAIFVFVPAKPGTAGGDYFRIGGHVSQTFQGISGTLKMQSASTSAVIVLARRFVVRPIRVG